VSHLGPLAAADLVRKSPKLSSTEYQMLYEHLKPRSLKVAGTGIQTQDCFITALEQSPSRKGSPAAVLGRIPLAI
jgi:hypothetical protein